MTIQQIAEVLNEKATNDGYSIGSLPELRKQYLNKKQLPAKIFTYHTIFDGEHRYAFHHGGRDEMQFNIGGEWIDDENFSRYALCFSLEASHSLPDPVNDLEPFRERFNQLVSTHPELFLGFKMWYYFDGERHGDFVPQKIPDSWFRYGAFICLGNVINKPLESLDDSDLNEVLSGFDRLLPIYKVCVLKQHAPTRNKIFTRLTSNENNWELPSPHRWRKENQGKKNVPFENQFGFGHEEWLLNPRYNVNGYQYGYIRGIQHAKSDVKRYDEVHLYTVKKEKLKNLVYYVGVIKNVIPIKSDNNEQKIIGSVIAEYNADMITEVEQINGDSDGIIGFPFKAVVKFKLKDLLFYDQPVFLPNFSLETYKRFQPYQFDSVASKVFEHGITGGNSGFLAGKSNQTIIYNRKNKESSITVERLHSEIVDALEAFLAPLFSLREKNLSIETTRFSGNIADVVTQEANKSVTIYEIKTSYSGRRNIREAISQLLDYALHSTDKVKNLVIVSPSLLSQSELMFLEGLKSKIDFPLEYLCYQKNAKVKFIKQ